jgi:chemotaxis protein methyltransferase CheR
MVTTNNNPWPSPAEYESLRQLVFQRSRIHLGADKKEMVCQRLQRRLKSTRLGSYQAYCAFLKSPQGQEEWVELIDAISTNVTSFFREGPHFEFLSRTALPQWVESPKRQPGDVFRVWSAGCCSGEEPYSAAIVLAEFFARHPEYRGEVVASDISQRILQRARQGIYQTEQVKLPEVEWMNRYFLKGAGPYKDCCRVKDDLKKMVAFHHANLFAPGYPCAASLDVIFCRNVMIYFDQETQERLVQRLSRKLTPGGYLLVGHSESLLGARHALSNVCPGVYCFQAPCAREAAPSLAYA